MRSLWGVHRSINLRESEIERRGWTKGQNPIQESPVSVLMTSFLFGYQILTGVEDFKRESSFRLEKEEAIGKANFRLDYSAA